jgi:hypothetical protein
MKLSAKALGLSLGIIFGLSVFITTILAIYTGYLQHWAELLLGVYPYYELSLQGAIAGLIWGFLDGLIGGVILAWIYNTFAPGNAS